MASQDELSDLRNDGIAVVYIDVERIWPHEHEYRMAAQLVTDADRASLAGFHFFADAKLHLGSKLLQRAIVVSVEGVPWSEVTLQQTEAGRPFYDGAHFDFNVSHQAGFVAAAVRSHDHLPVGIDVVSTIPPPQWGFNWIDDFQDVFTKNEYAFMYSTDHNDPVSALFHLWALKEAYTKALGIGIVTNLLSIEFRDVVLLSPARPYTSATRLFVNDRPMNWRFELFRLSETVIAAVATPAGNLPERRSSIKAWTMREVMACARR
ncbi:4'-phosphopantetheinyl transferase superfamily [Dipodascopsis tothii]|uniref:4'-phosphopantetheinyl transferase superfamily n=1 Tax=Dipodascopsis tothii TaxID=44089 RepID=UPI0034CD06D2